MSVEDAARVVQEYLEDCDLDTFTDIVSYISGAKVFLDPEDSECENLIVETDTEEYAGMFDAILKDERNKS